MKIVLPHSKLPATRPLAANKDDQRERSLRLGRDPDLFETPYVDLGSPEQGDLHMLATDLRHETAERVVAPESYEAFGSPFASSEPLTTPSSQPTYPAVFHTSGSS